MLKAIAGEGPKSNNTPELKFAEVASEKRFLRCLGNTGLLGQHGKVFLVKPRQGSLILAFSLLFAAGADESLATAQIRTGACSPWLAVTCHWSAAIAITAPPLKQAGNPPSFTCRPVAYLTSPSQSS
jgi:hypothetical protein